jgi:hypothetical protein
LYLWNPSIVPDQPWASRRFATAAIPLFLLSAAVALDEVAGIATRLTRSSAWPRRISAIGGVAIIAFPLATTWPVADFRTGAGFLPAIEQTCAKVGPNSAILFTQRDYEGLLLDQAIRSWCDVPVATLDVKITQQQLHEVAEAFQREGRTLWLADSTPQSIVALDPGLTPSLLGIGNDPYTLPFTLDGPPQTYTLSQLPIYAAKVS